MRFAGAADKGSAGEIFRRANNICFAHLFYPFVWFSPSRAGSISICIQFGRVPWQGIWHRTDVAKPIFLYCQHNHPWQDICLWL